MKESKPDPTVSILYYGPYATKNQKPWYWRCFCECVSWEYFSSKNETIRDLQLHFANHGEGSTRVNHSRALQNNQMQAEHLTQKQILQMHVK